MGNETTTTTANDTVVTVLHNGLVDELRPLVLPYKAFHMKADPVSKGRVVQIPLVTDPGAAAAINEATDATNTAISTGVATVTAAEQAIMATPTDVLEASSPLGTGWVPKVLARSLSERLGDQFCALYAAFSNVTGTSGTDLSVAQFIAAVAALAGRDTKGPYVAVLHNQQILDLRSGSGNTPGGILPAFAANQTGNQFVASPNFRQSIMDSIQREAYVGNLLGVDIWNTTSVVTANNGADRAGAVFGPEAIAYHELWGERIELQRDASLRATEIVGSYDLGVIEVDDSRGQSIITDA